MIMAPHIQDRSIMGGSAKKYRDWFKDIAGCCMAVALLGGAALAASPAAAAPVLFASVPVSNGCGLNPIGGQSAIALFAPGSVIPNTIINPNDAKVVSATVGRAGWYLFSFVPPAARTINPGNICIFERCGATSITLTCMSINAESGVDQDGAVSVRWLREKQEK